MANLERREEWETFAATVSTARNAVRPPLSQKQLGKAMGASRPWVNHMEHARAMPSERWRVVKLADAVKLDFAALWEQVVPLTTPPERQEFWDDRARRAGLSESALDPAAADLVATLEGLGKLMGRPHAPARLVLATIKAWQAFDTTAMDYMDGPPKRPAERSTVVLLMHTLTTLQLIGGARESTRTAFVRSLIQLANAFIGADIAAKPGSVSEIARAVAHRTATAMDQPPEWAAEVLGGIGVGETPGE